MNIEYTFFNKEAILVGSFLFRCMKKRVVCIISEEVTMKKKTIVMKFGGAAVSSPESFSRVADIIVSRMEQYQRVVVVVSAIWK